jgi:HlyD family secretion protein
MDGEKLKPVSLTLGISDGTFTEILRGDLKEGQEVVIGTAGKGGGTSSGSSPRLRL